VRRSGGLHPRFSLGPLRGLSVNSAGASSPRGDGRSSVLAVMTACPVGMSVSGRLLTPAFEPLADERDPTSVPSFYPGLQHDLECSGRSMLSMLLQIDFCDAVGVGHVVADGCSG
jgi:hypothetical protein